MNSTVEWRDTVSTLWALRWPLDATSDGEEGAAVTILAIWSDPSTIVHRDEASLSGNLSLEFLYEHVIAILAMCFPFCFSATDFKLTFLWAIL